MKRLSFVLILVLSFGFVTACFAMGKLNTQDEKTSQEIVKETEPVVSEAYSAPVEVEEVEDSMKMDIESVQEVIQEPEVIVESEIIVEPEITENLGVLDDAGIADEFKSLATIGEKVSLLLGKANELYGSEQFQKVIDVAQYILQYLDADSQEAKDLLTKAKDALVATTSEKIDDITTGISEKLGVFGGQEASE
ncbi:hypothetical protein ACFL2Y_00650 [Candidatus Omnitrophota bacterium]